MSQPPKYTGCSSVSVTVVSGVDRRRAAVGATLSIFHSTLSDGAPSVTLATSVEVPAGTVIAPRSRLRRLAVFGSSAPFSVHVTGRTRSAGWLVST